MKQLKDFSSSNYIRYLSFRYIDYTYYEQNMDINAIQ